MDSELLTFEKTLKTIFLERQRRSRRYSLRAFSRDLNCSAGKISAVLSGKTAVGSRLLKKLMNSSRLSESERKLLQTATRGHRHIPLPENDYSKVLDSSNLKHLFRWETHAILSLLKNQNAKADPLWVANRLCIPVTTAKESLEELCACGVIHIQDDQHVILAANLASAVPSPQPSLAAKSYQELLEQTLPYIWDLPREVSALGTLTFAIDRAKIPQVKQLMKRLMGKISSISEDSPSNEVFNLSIILQPLTAVQTPDCQKLKRP
ncbi:DUF4423 domain-containing protein [Bdellovibrio svalbardensis]|uniref:DUF4423 domain-containing protein n=1 Tax=Bdellovibrio svalbardensis TaxID=2972972 RepID=A0ABT6DJW3_9BACT|nr:DUF4423 domain-containing protein [Bdellovibrio svalbardensis]MDG0816214.1 DUF4423 domain-containing protein [Bdellovibrio svalbardensis]